MAIALIHNKTIKYTKDKPVSQTVKPVEIIQQKPNVSQPQLIQDIYGEEERRPIKAVDVKVDRQYNVSSVETNNVKSDVINTKVNNKVDQLRRLRRGN